MPVDLDLDAPSSNAVDLDLDAPSGGVDLDLDAQPDQPENPTWAGIKGYAKGFASELPIIGENIVAPIDNPHSNVPGAGVSRLLSPLVQGIGEFVLGSRLGGTGGGAALAGTGQLERQAKEHRLAQMQETGEDPGITAGYRDLNRYDALTAGVAAGLPSGLGKVGGAIGASGLNPFVKGAAIVGADVAGATAFTAAARKARNPDAPLSDLASGDAVKEYATNSLFPLFLGAVGHGASFLNSEGHTVTDGPMVEQPPPTPEESTHPRMVWPTDQGVFSRKTGGDVQNLTGDIRAAEQARSDFNRSKPISTVDLDLDLPPPFTTNRETIAAPEGIAADTAANSGLENTGTETANSVEQNQAAGTAPVDLDLDAPAIQQVHFDEAGNATPIQPEGQVIPNAEEVRGRQGQLPEIGQVEAGGGEVGGNDVQLPEEAGTEAGIAGQQVDLDLDAQGGEPNVGRTGHREGQENPVAPAQVAEPENLLPPEQAPGISRPVPEDITGIRNSVVDAERQKREADPRQKIAVKTFGGLWDSTVQEAASNPDAGNRLVADLQSKIRPLSDAEDAMLTHEQISRQNEFDSAVKAENESPSDANQARLDAARERVYEVYDVGSRAGTESGRGLNARKLLVKDDYSLAKMEAREFAAMGGLDKLTPDKKTTTIDQVAKDHARIAELERQIGERSAFDKLVEQIESERQTAKAVTQKDVGSFFEQQAARTRERLASGRTKPTDQDLAIIGAHKMAVSSGISKFESVLGPDSWDEEMVREFGEEIRPRLNEIHAKAKTLYDDTVSKIGAPKKPKLSPIEKVQRAAAEGGDVSQKHIFDLAREHYNAGKREGKILDAVHQQLQEHYPNITRREVGQKFSEYGEKTYPSKEEDLTALRELRRMEQLGLAIEDANNAVPPKRTGFQQDNPSDAILSKQEELKVAMERTGVKPEPSEKADSLRTPEEAYNRRLMRGLQKRIAETQRRIDEEDYTTPPAKAKFRVTDENKRLQAEQGRVKLNFERRVMAHRIANRNLTEKALSVVSKAKRLAVLSGTNIIIKLTAAANIGIGFSHLEEGVGGAISKVFPSLAEKAPRHGGMNLDAQAKAIADTWNLKGKNFADALKTGNMDIDLLYGKNDIMPRDWTDYVGSLHYALKTPLKQHEFTLSFEKRLAWAGKHGMDISDPEIQLKASVDALKDANASIFSEDNRVVTAYKMALKGLRKPDAQGHVPFWGNAAATAAEFELPVVKIPTNIVARIFEYTFGTPKGALALARGVKRLSNDQADVVMRNLKRGLVGNAMMALGWYGYKSIGGYYEEGRKKNPNDPNYGAIRIGDSEVPSNYIHYPGLELLQMAANAHRVIDSRMHKKDAENRGISDAIFSTLIGTAQQVPFVREATELPKLINPSERPQFLGAQAASIVPQGVQQFGRFIDKDEQGNPIKRDAKGVMGGIQNAFPLWREQLPVKKNKNPFTAR